MAAPISIKSSTSMGKIQDESGVYEVIADLFNIPTLNLPRLVCSLKGVSLWAKGEEKSF